MTVWADSSVIHLMIAGARITTVRSHRRWRNRRGQPPDAGGLPDRSRFQPMGIRIDDETLSRPTRSALAGLGITGFR
ncbi:hypothetical protein [Streptomyces sp. NPDC001978]|uniref:hypothetical protein n=1 Tax=Streptomyces sp. NPDC001978 TaxID=3364627 RepID=UPI0036C47F84